MDRERLLHVVEELREVIVKHNVSPKDAESIAKMLLDDIERTIEKEKKTYEREGKFK